MSDLHSADVYPDGRLHEGSSNGVVRFRADDTTRTVTTYDETGAVTSTRPYTDDENAAADAVLADAVTLTDVLARIARIEAHLWPPRGPGRRSARHRPHHGRLRWHLARRATTQRRRQGLAQRHHRPAHDCAQRLPRCAIAVDAPVRGGFWWRRA